jgi:hypothetical protein
MTLNPWPYIRDTIKETIIEKLVKGYLKGFVERQKGYVFLISGIFAVVQIAANIVTSPEVLSVLNIVLSTFADVAPLQLTPQEVTAATTMIVGLLGLINKLVKKAKGLDQVPTIVIEKKEIKKALEEGGSNKVAQLVLKKDPKILV